MSQRAPQDREKAEAASESPPSPESVEDTLATARALMSHAGAVLARARELLQKMEEFLRRSQSQK